MGEFRVDEGPFMFALLDCALCKRMFTAAPSLVPVYLRTREVGGTLGPEVETERLPLCEGCVGRINAALAKKGLPTVQVREGAYEPEPAPEGTY